ncbi:MAG TPA: hypothetical protein PKD70_07120 [Saprospiraceae bacterium]|nr:hypothetical protein [Saprospiraceae bacterium]HMP13633.1 hypothetical protein [Saprospiraceae bacterium]
MYFVLFMCLWISSTTYAQDASQDTLKLWQIQTLDDNEYIGKIIEINGEQLVLQTQNIGTITLLIQSIRLMREINPKGIKHGQYWSEHPQSTRYFLAPTGHGLRKGEGYYQNTWIFFNQANIGLTDQISIGGGIFPAFLFLAGTVSSTVVWITPKVSFPIKEDVFNLGIGGVGFVTIGSENSSGSVLGYGVATLGNRDKNITLGLGSPGLVIVGGMLRTGTKGYLIMEGYFVQDLNLVLLGGRTVWSKISLDYGMLGSVSSFRTLVVAPWLGVAIPFGK